MNRFLIRYEPAVVLASTSGAGVRNLAPVIHSFDGARMNFSLPPTVVENIREVRAIKQRMLERQQKVCGND